MNIDSKLMVGIDTSDDAGVYVLTDDLALIQTVDFFTPIADDPYIFGGIAAANALSDIYAMGGKPLIALNIIAFPLATLPSQVLADILRGGAEKIREAGAVLAGGHSIQDDEPKYGLAVTGTAHPSEIWTNAGAKAGDILILTKPLGVGIITTALRKKKDAEGNIIRESRVSPLLEQKVYEVMLELNATAAAAAKNVGINACTDVTGFGLLGHAWEMSRASNVQIEISVDSVPLIEGARELGLMGFIAGGNRSNLKHLEDKTSFGPDVEPIDKYILADPITSGGLLMAVPVERARILLDNLHESGIKDARIIGRVLAGSPKILVTRFGDTPAEGKVRGHTC